MAILVVGNSGSGKSTAIQYLVEAAKDCGEQKIKVIFDRLSLEQAVLRDVEGVLPDVDGVRVGRHSKLLADGEPGRRRFHVLDGTLPNRIHEEIIASLHSLPDSLVFVEYAIGPNYSFGEDKEPLLQDAKSLVSLLGKYDLLSKVQIIELVAPLPLRAKRQDQRRDSLSQDTFSLYFPDGGGFTDDERKALAGPCPYALIDNTEGDLNLLNEKIRHTYCNVFWFDPYVPLRSA